MIQSWDKFCRVEGRDGIHKVIEYGALESKVRSERTGETFNIYTAKCHADAALKIKSSKDRRAASSAIGMPKTKPGKR